MELTEAKDGDWEINSELSRNLVKRNYADNEFEGRSIGIEQSTKSQSGQ